jgi:hypothetical protein
VLIIGYVVTGLLVWMFGKNAFHIGASGVVYAYISYLFWSGIFRRETKSIVLSLLVLVIYGGFFDGLKPQEGVSWESHLLGSMVGIVMAFILKGIYEQEDKKVKVVIKEQRTKFLPQDAFLYTKQERAYMAWLAEQERLRQEELKKMNNIQTD